MKKIFAAMSIALLATTAFAQSGTNSPYSMYGIGVLSDQGNSFNRGMNGVGLGFRPHDQINYLNPASYSAVDSLSFIFDAGLSLQMTCWAFSSDDQLQGRQSKQECQECKL